MSTINSKLGFKFNHKPSFQPNHKFNLTIATLLALVLSTVMGTFGGVSALASTGSFKDVGSGTAYQEEITDLAKEGIIHGYGDGNYGPNNSLTRGELAKIIKNTLWGKAYSNLKCADFPDVDTNNTFYLEITTLKCEGIVNGYPDGTFRPNAKVSIGEAIKFTFNNNKYTPASKPLSNYNQSKLFKKNLARDTFGTFIDKAVQNGALDQDYDGGLLDISQYIDRKQMANLIHRARKPNQEKIKKRLVPVNPEDQKILLELEKQLDIKISRAIITPYMGIELISFGYILNSQGRVTYLNLEDSQVQNKHLPIIVKLTNLEFLELSINQITKIEGLDSLTSLQILYLDHNQITKIEGLDNLTGLKELNLYNNQITKIEGLDNLTNLQKLDLGSNKITKIEGLDSLTSLQKLSLGSNQITKIEGLDNLTGLKELWLGYNQITKIEGLDSLTSLQKLSLGSNQISTIQELEKLTNLQVLSLGSNQITKIEGLDKLTSLEGLSLGYNQITKIEGLDSLTSLRELILQSNQITDATPLEALLLNQKKAGKPVLDIASFYSHRHPLEGNPLQTPPMEVMVKGSEAFLKWVEENR